MKSLRNIMISGQRGATINILETIEAKKASLSKSEMKVADVVCREPDATIVSSIARLAQMADVSEPTVNRFCRSLKCKGFPDFKLKLAQSLAVGTPYVNRDVDMADNADDYTSKIFEANISALKEGLAQIDVSAIERAVDILSQAKRLEIYGLGVSAPVALDAQNKFFRLNIPVVCHQDSLMQRMSASVLGTGDVVLCISYTGRTKHLVEVAQLARDTGATVVAMTKPESPLAATAHHIIGTQAAENTDMFMPMKSRIVQLTVIDILATGVTLKRGPEFRGHLVKVKDCLVPTRYPAETLN